jgi:hypothetical protein
MKLTKRLFIPDCHFDHVDPKAFQLMLDVAQAFKPDEVVYLGDYWDLACLSSHERDLRDPQYLIDEITEGIAAMDRVEILSKAKSFVFMAGNHMDRFRRFISNQAPQLYGAINVKDLFQIPYYYKFFDYGQGGHYKMGELVATHGSLGGQCPSVAHLRKYGHSVITGHVHQLGAHFKTEFNGRETVGISAGWLGDSKTAAKYIKDVPNWQQGFVLTWHKPNGQFWFQLVHIVNTKEGKECIYEGAHFKR